MTTQMDTAQREAVLIEDAHIRPMMGLEILEPLPSARIPYAMVDPYILVHEAVVPITPERANLDTRHPHRGFDNLWYAISGSSSTGHSTGPGGAMERARLEAGSLLKLRAGRGVWHAEGIGADELREGKAGGQMRGLLFWVNLARKDKEAEPSAQLLRPHEVPVRHDRGAIVRVLVGEGSAVELGTAGLILDVELPTGGGVACLVPPGFNGFVYMLEGRGQLRRQPAPGEPLADRGSGTRWCARRGESPSRDAVHAHGRPALWRNACLQRAVRGLTRPLRWVCHQLSQLLGKLPGPAGGDLPTKEDQQ